MSTSDLINGLFEFGGGLILMLNCRRIHKDKQVKGISIFPFAFYTGWGVWNLWFYPAVGAWFSFWGGVLVVSVNAVFVCQVAYHLRRGKP